MDDVRKRILELVYIGTINVLFVRYTTVIIYISFINNNIYKAIYYNVICLCNTHYPSIAHICNPLLYIYINYILYYTNPPIEPFEFFLSESFIAELSTQWNI